MSGVRLLCGSPLLGVLLFFGLFQKVTLLAIKGIISTIDADNFRVLACFLMLRYAGIAHRDGWVLLGGAIR
jgi:hypothetical protein